MKFGALSALVLALSAQAPGVQAQCPESWVAAYYPPNMLTPGVCPFSAATLPSGAIAGQDYTASMSPGSFPRMATSPPEAWAATVNAWCQSLNPKRNNRPGQAQRPTVASASAGAAAVVVASASTSDGATATANDTIVVPAMTTKRDLFPGSSAIAALQTMASPMAVNQATPAAAGVPPPSPIVGGQWAAPVVVQASGLLQPGMDGASGTNANANANLGLGVARRRRQNQGDLLIGTGTGTFGAVQQQAPAVTTTTTSTTTTATQAPATTAAAVPFGATTTGTYSAPTVVSAAVAVAASTVTTYPNTLAAPATKLWNGADLKFIKNAWASGTAPPRVANAITQVINRAQLEVAKTDIYTITSNLSFIVPPSGNRKDFVSIGPYMWPCNNIPVGCLPGTVPTGQTCNMATGYPWVSCSGNSLKNPQVINAKLGDYWISAYWGAVTDLALAYYYTENVAFARRAVTLTYYFFCDNVKAMNPNLLYGQMFPGVRPGSASGIIDVIKLSEILDAVTILKMAGTTIYPLTQQTTFNTWVTSFFNWYSASALGKEARMATNNIAWWYYEVMLHMALYSNNAQATTLAYNITTVLTKQIAADGSLPKEMARSTSRKYVGYQLTVMTRCANLMKNSAVPYKLWNNAAFVRAANWHYNYALDSIPWPVRDDEDWTGANNTNWKFWSEFLKTSAVAYGNTNFENKYVQTGAQSLKSFGQAPGPAYKYILPV